MRINQDHVILLDGLGLKDPIEQLILPMGMPIFFDHLFQQGRPSQKINPFGMGWQPIIIKWLAIKNRLGE